MGKRQKNEQETNQKEKQKQKDITKDKIKTGYQKWMKRTKLLK